MPDTPPVTCIDAATLAAYRAARYRVLGARPFTLKIGSPSAALAAAQQQHGVVCSAFITACNPCGQPLDAGENLCRQRRLAQDLLLDGYVFLPGIGEDPAGKWPGEASFLVFGLARDAAIALGRRHAQNAVLWSGAEAVPELLLLR